MVLRVGGKVLLTERRGEAEDLMGGIIWVNDKEDLLTCACDALAES